MGSMNFNNNSGFISTTSNPSLLTISSGSNTVILEKEASLQVNGRVIINGEDLNDRLSRIETFLYIPVRDVGMEEKYPRLKSIWKEYTLELEKYKTWEELKK